MVKWRGISTQSPQGAQRRGSFTPDCRSRWTFLVARLGEILRRDAPHERNPSSGVWLTITGPLPVILVNVASKRFGVYVSGLESTLVGWFVNVAFKWVMEGVV